MKDEVEIFCENLRMLRERSGLSQAELAQECNLSPSYVGKIERFDKYPSLETLLRFSQALEVSLPELFDPFLNDNGDREVLPGDLLGDEYPKFLQFLESFDNFDEGVCLSNREGRILFANETYRLLVNASKNDVSGQNLTQLDPRFEDVEYASFWKSIRPGYSRVQKEEISQFSKTTVPVRFITRKTPIGNHLLLFTIAQPDPMNDPSSRQDPIRLREWDSGLYRKPFFMEILKLKLLESRRYRTPVSMGIFSLEREGTSESSPRDLPAYTFIQVFKGLERNLRESDVVGRVDTNELGVILSQTELNSARKMESRIRKTFDELRRDSVKVSLRVGIAESPSEATSHNQLFQQIRKDMK